MMMTKSTWLVALGLMTAGYSTLASGCSSSDSGSGGSGGGKGGTDCASYCSAIMANCTGDNAQFTTQDNCIASCAAMPLGTASDTTGNTLGCRIYHAGLAKSDPATHCQHAGPGGAGVCGANCDGYCQLAMKYCSGPNQVYSSEAECQTTCKGAKTDEKLGVSPEPTGNQVACLLYHAQEGSTVPADHCLGDLKKDPGGASITCQDGAGGAAGASGDGG